MLTGVLAGRSPGGTATMEPSLPFDHAAAGAEHDRAGLGRLHENRDYGLGRAVDDVTVTVPGPRPS